MTRLPLQLYTSVDIYPRIPYPKLIKNTNIVTKYNKCTKNMAAAYGGQLQSTLSGACLYAI